MRSNREGRERDLKRSRVSRLNRKWVLRNGGAGYPAVAVHVRGKVAQKAG
jgi:hypothetical protein